MMSLDNVQSTVTSAIPIMFAWMAVSEFKIVTNPPKVITIYDSGFRVDVNLMDAYIPYLVEFMSSRYLIWKKKDNALVVTEVE